jgi:hypothetical protein
MANTCHSPRAAVYLGSLLGFAALLMSSARADAQAVVKVNDVVYLKLGIYLQAWADWQEVSDAQNSGSGGYQQNLFIRRARILMAGRVAEGVYFFADTDNARLGYNKTSSTSLATGFQLIDGLAEWRIADALILDGGLLRVPYSRVALTASTRQLFLDVPAYGYLQQTATQSTSGNSDTGFLARGYFVDHRLEYRVGVFSGVRLPGARNALRVSGRLQWEFLEREDLYSSAYAGPALYGGTYLGTKKLLAVGTSFDAQMSYRYYAADAFYAVPVGANGSLEGLIQYQYVDGGTTFTTLPLQNTMTVDAGYYLKNLKAAPVLRYEHRTFNGNPAKEEERWGVSLNYYPYGHNFNVKGALFRFVPKAGVATNEFAIQFQVFYF